MASSGFLTTLANLFARGFRKRRRPERAEPGFEFAYVNQDGSVRELSADERAYLSADFAGGDGGRPYIKSRYESRDGWGSLSGFIERRAVPRHVNIQPVHPDYDALVKQLPSDPLGMHRASGDTIVVNDDGSVTCTPNAEIPHRERFELARGYVLSEQRRREARARS